MTTVSREFQIFVKPIGATCNLNCSYCYYLDKKSLYRDKAQLLMNDDILEKYIIQHIEASGEPIINFSWHGGEPLLAGIDFFRKAIHFQTANKPVGRKIINGIQTNGMLINEEWCRFFAREEFIVGISVDGPAEFHNVHRHTKDGHPSWHKVMGGFQLLMKHGVVPEILCVVNSENVRHPLEIYKFFKQLGTRYITFLPLVEHETGSSSGVSSNTVPSVEFGQFLCAVFDEWVENDIGELKIQIFEEAARTAFNQEHTLCIFKIICGGVPVVENNGDFFSCDQYVDSEHLVGNIMKGSLVSLLDSERQKSFGESKSFSLPEYCTGCEVRTMCNGECPKNRFILTPDGETGLNYLCSGYKLFFNYCRPFVDAIAEAWKNQSG
jgi:uncharacterized protein